MTLNDFPAFAVEEITEASDELRLRGRFSHLAGVTLGRSYLYCGDAQWVGDLIECDADTRHAVFTAPSWVQRDRIKVGTVWSYKGPGTMRDYGVLSHPRYELKLPGISTEDKYRSFSFAGVPSEEMTLMLYIAGATLDKLEKPLTALDTQITAQLFEEATPLVPRRVLCSATGSPSTASRDSRWVATGNDAFVALWHSRCLRVPMSKDRRYTLTLEIADSGLSSLAKIVVPTLEGGGYELP